LGGGAQGEGEAKLVHGGLTDQILSAAFTVHTALGPGLLESVYEQCLCHELSEKGLTYDRQIEIPILYKDVSLQCGLRADLIVEGKVLLELKSVDEIHPIHEAQLLTYLRLTHLTVGLLLNFNVTALKHGIVRRVL
jgi:GxxExxY protein